jgi:hypothetical protein
LRNTRTGGAFGTGPRSVPSRSKSNKCIAIFTPPMPSVIA